MTDNHVVERGTRKLEPFLRELALRLTLHGSYTFSESDGVYYLGGGYWRARPVLHVEDLPNGGLSSTFVGVVLINPDRTADELAAIAAAMRILCR